MVNSPCNTTIVTQSPEETRALGRCIGAGLAPGSVVALRGGLGAGKTCLAQGIAQGLGIDEPVTSPTYTIIAEYAGRLPLYHIDAYRLTGDDDFCAVGGDEYLDGAGVTVIEWSERLTMPGHAITITLTVVDGIHREIRICTPPRTKQ